MIAAGCSRDEDGNCDRPIVVASGDGQHWETIEVGARADLGFDSIRSVSGRLFAYGYGHYAGSGGAVVWTSSDAREWSRVESNAFVGRGVDDVISTPVGTIAVGYNAPVDSDNVTGFVTWPVHGDGSFGAPRSHDDLVPLVAGVVWTGDEFLAWGGAEGPYPSRVTRLLSSPDGRTWRPRGDIRAVDHGYVGEIIKVGDRLVAVGYEGERFPLLPQAWTSDDKGRTWKPAPVEGQDARIASVKLEGSELIARGLQSWGADEVPVSWASMDGRSWTRLPGDRDLPGVRGFSGLSPIEIGDRTCVAGSFDEETRAAIYCRAT